ncbi:MAG: hypothetical protein HQK49_16795 [Oligoflexia bacterium]|nr:hypothetical protein [Oligoflexia bacterium]
MRLPFTWESLFSNDNPIISVVVGLSAESELNLQAMVQVSVYCLSDSGCNYFIGAVGIDLDATNSVQNNADSGTIVGNGFTLNPPSTITLGLRSLGSSSASVKTTPTQGYYSIQMSYICYGSNCHNNSSVTFSNNYLSTSSSPNFHGLLGSINL